MENKINEVMSVLKRMLQYAEREGRDGMLMPMSVEQVVVILKALEYYEERCQYVADAIAASCGYRDPHRISKVDHSCNVDHSATDAAAAKAETTEAAEGNTGETVSRYASPLGETVAGMLSPDYRERFKAEYAQLKIRHEKLKAFNNKIEAARRTRYCPLDSDERVTVEMPKHDCPDDLLREQQNIMSEYLRVLEVRAVIEGIDLGGV